MATFLLTWNPESWLWPQDDFRKAVEQTLRGRKHADQWSIGIRSGGVDVGDRVFLLRQHTERGIVASGLCTSGVWEDQHWDGSERLTTYVSVEWDRVLEACDRLPTEVLQASVPEVPWRHLQGSGVEAKGAAAQRLEIMWEDHVRAVESVVASGGRGRNPTWARDELILALDLYLRLGLLSDNHPEVVELSRVLNELPIHTERPDLITFRNPNGVALKLANFRSLDPTHSGRGMSRSGKGDAEVWEQFAGRPKELKAIADSLRAGAEVASFPTAPEEAEDEALEGRLLYRLHRTRERNLALAAKKKADSLKRSGRLVCDVCGFDFAERYGDLGSGFIECHHTRPLSEAGVSTTRLADLSLLCANCHRMVHRQPGSVSLDRVREAMAGAFDSQTEGGNG